MFNKKGASNNLAELTGKHLWQGIFFTNVAGLIPAKETPTQVFSCQFYETFEDTFFYGTLPGDCFWIGLMVKKINSVSLIFLNSQLYHALPWAAIIILVQQRTLVNEENIINSK